MSDATRPAAVGVRVPAALRDLTGGASTVEVAVEAPLVTLVVVLDALAVRYPALERRVRDERGVVRPHVNLFVGADNVRDLDGPATVVPPGVDVSVMPAVSGG